MKKRSNRGFRKKTEEFNRFAYISSRNAKLAKDRKEARKKIKEEK